MTSSSELQGQEVAGASAARPELVSRRVKEPLRILFELPYPGYHRIYGSTIRLLAERGHTVLLSYDKASKLRDRDYLEVEHLDGVTVIDSVPTERPVWGSLSRFLRVTADYARFLDPRFQDAPNLRRMMGRYLPERAKRLKGIQGLDRMRSAALLRLFRTLERAIPSDFGVEEFVRSLEADVVVVTPLVGRGEGGSMQTDVVKAARRLGLPTGVAVTSWDHLTSKGLLRGDPDAVFVWNEAQKTEAKELHGIADQKIVITGAQLFDQWFDLRPTLSRAEFTERVGLNPARPYVLYVGSSKNIVGADDEVRFVRHWVKALRKHGLDDVGILVRPHPGNALKWAEADLTGLKETVVFPRGRTHVPMTDDEELDYYHSIAHSAAVVGINTSAIIEAAIVGRAVYTVRVPEFASTQEGTLHFRHLLPSGGGCLHMADDLPAHAAQLRKALKSPAGDPGALSFVSSFVRPLGLDRPATPILVEAIESLGRQSPRRRGVPVHLQPVRLLLRLGIVLFSERMSITPSSWTIRGRAAALLRRRPRVDQPFAGVTARENNRNRESFIRTARRRDTFRLIAKRYWSVAKSVWKSRKAPTVRDVTAVSDMYEGHYDRSVETYAKKRDKRRDVFMVRGRPVPTDGWYTFAYRSDLITNVVDRIDVKSVLEVGSGSGINVALLAVRRPDLDLTGIELTRHGVEQSKALAKSPDQRYLDVVGAGDMSAEQRAALTERTRFVQGDATKMPFDDKSFDFSFTCLVLEQIPDEYPKILEEMRRVTRKYCAFIEPFREANGPIGKACLRSSNYFRAPYRSFAQYGFEPVYFSTDIPQKVQFKTAIMIAKVNG